MMLLLDIGNTHTHLGLADHRRVRRHADLATQSLLEGDAPREVRRFLGATTIGDVALCSVVPAATPPALRLCQRITKRRPFVLESRTIQGVGINYPKPQTIGPDRLANALAARRHYGSPVVVVDFGTAVTFDVVDRRGDYVGGIIAPGLAAMTEYLHEKTALLPRIRIREIKAVIGKNTEDAMLIGAVHGYRGLIRQLLRELKTELKSTKLPVIATGGYARLLAARLPEITAVNPLLTLEGLRLFCLNAVGSGQAGGT